MTTLLDDMEAAAIQADVELSDHARRWAKGVEYEYNYMAREYPGWSLVVSGCSNRDKDDNPCYECEACSHEAEFSWSDCDLCGSSLGGSRHYAAWILPGRPDLDPDETIIHLGVCWDCLFYIANGDTPE